MALCQWLDAACNRSTDDANQYGKRVWRHRSGNQPIEKTRLPVAARAA